MNFLADASVLHTLSCCPLWIIISWLPNGTAAYVSLNIVNPSFIILSKKSSFLLRRMGSRSSAVKLQKNLVFAVVVDRDLIETWVRLTASPHYRAFHLSQTQHQQLAEVLALWILQP